MINIAMWAILIGTTIWVGYDSRKYRIAVGKKPYSLNNGSLAWVMSCVLLWIGIFPYYLVRRARVLKSRKIKSSGPATVQCPLCQQELEVPSEMFGQVAQCPACNRDIRLSRDAATDEPTTDPAPGTVIGFILFAVQCVVLVLMFTGDIKMTTADLQTQIEQSIRETWANEPALAGATIHSLSLIHKTGNQYEGLLEVSMDGQTERLTIDVTYDGKQFMWQVRL